MWYSVQSISVGNVLRFLFRYQLLLFHLPGIFFISLSFSSLFLFPARSLSQATLCFYFFLHIGCSPCLVICRRVCNSSNPLSRYYLLSPCCTSVTFSSFAIICFVLFCSILFCSVLFSPLCCSPLCFAVSTSVSACVSSMIFVVALVSFCMCVNLVCVMNLNLMMNCLIYFLVLYSITTYVSWDDDIFLYYIIKYHVIAVQLKCGTAMHLH